MEITGVLHLGANVGEEIPIYEQCNIPQVIFVEPLPHVFQKLVENCSASKLKTECINVAVSNYEGTTQMYVEHKNGGQSSSLLKPKLHLEQYPDIVFDERLNVKVTQVDRLLNDKSINFINMDLQAGELNALKGAVKTLAHIDYIYSEVNRAELYEGARMIEELDAFLDKFGFIRVETDWAGDTWGDSAYIRKSLLNPQHYVEVPEQFKPSCEDVKLIYPPMNNVTFEQYFNDWYVKNGAKLKLKRKLLPVNWTAYYVGHDYGRNIGELQEFLDTLPRDEKYFAVCQYDDGLSPNDLTGLDIKVFGMGGVGDIAIPLTCQLPTPVKRNKDIFCSFVGRNTHPIREAIFKLDLPENKYKIIETGSMPYDEYTEIMERSVLALCPRGYGKTSFRIAEALNAGAVPVYISDEFWFNVKDTVPGLFLSIENVSYTPRFLSILQDFYFAHHDGYQDKVRMIPEYFEKYYRYENLRDWIIKNVK